VIVLAAKVPSFIAPYPSFMDNIVYN